MNDIAPVEPTEVVLRFLESVGRRSDAELYLSLFRAAAKERFACISVDGPVINAALDAVVVDLRFLSVLGLVPVVVVGLFDAAHAALHAQALAAALQRVGVQSALVAFDKPQAIVDATRDGVVPVVTLDGRAGGSEAARFASLSRLALTLQTQKLIFLQRRGGLRQDGRLVPLVNLTREYAGLVDSAELSQKQRFLLTETRTLVCDTAPYSLTAAIASPLELLRELFTMRGAGTFLRRGANIISCLGWAGVAQDRLRTLLDSAFGRPVENDFFAKTPWKIYLDEEYRGAAVLIQTPLGPYLSKFAVGRQAQGEGIGGDLWKQVSSDHPVMFWRSRRDNPIDSWYVRQCDGLLRLPEWNVFWKGFAPEGIAAAVAYASTQPIDFKPPAHS